MLPLFQRFQQLLLAAGTTVLLAQPVVPPSPTYPPHIEAKLLERAKSGDAAAIYDLLEEMTWLITNDDAFWAKLAKERLPIQAAQGNVEAMARYGWELCRNSNASKENKTKGLDLLKKAAEKNSIFAIDKVYAQMDHFKDTGPLIELQKKWWPGVQKRIEAGDTEVMRYVSRGIFHLIGVSEAECDRILDKAALELGDRECLFELGLRSDNKYGQSDKALDCFTRAAERGHVRAAFFGAMMAISQQCAIEGDPYRNPGAAARTGDELAALLERNAGGRNSEWYEYDEARYASAHPQDASVEEDGTPARDYPTLDAPAAAGKTKGTENRSVRKSKGSGAKGGKKTVKSQGPESGKNRPAKPRTESPK